jgi:hypothetical protein
MRSACDDCQLSLDAIGVPLSSYSSKGRIEQRICNPEIHQARSNRPHHYFRQSFARHDSADQDVVSRFNQRTRANIRRASSPPRYPGRTASTTPMPVLSFFPRNTAV